MYSFMRGGLKEDIKPADKMDSDIEDDILEDDSLIAQNDTGDEELNDDLLRSDEEDLTAGCHEDNVLPAADLQSPCGPCEPPEKPGLVSNETILSPEGRVLASGRVHSHLQEHDDGALDLSKESRTHSVEEQTEEVPDPGEVIDLQINGDEFQVQLSRRWEEHLTQEDWVEEHFKPGGETATLLICSSVPLTSAQSTASPAVGPLSLQAASVFEEPIFLQCSKKLGFQTGLSGIHMAPLIPGQHMFGQRHPNSQADASPSVAGPAPMGGGQPPARLGGPSGARGAPRGPLDPPGPGRAAASFLCSPGEASTFWTISAPQAQQVQTLSDCSCGPTDPSLLARTEPIAAGARRMPTPAAPVRPTARAVATGMPGVAKQPSSARAEACARAVSEPVPAGRRRGQKVKEEPPSPPTPLRILAKPGRLSKGDEDEEGYEDEEDEVASARYRLEEQQHLRQKEQRRLLQARDRRRRRQQELRPAPPTQAVPQGIPQPARPRRRAFPNLPLLRPSPDPRGPHLPPGRPRRHTPLLPTPAPPALGLHSPHDGRFVSAVPVWRAMRRPGQGAGHLGGGPGERRALMVMRVVRELLPRTVEGEDEEHVSGRLSAPVTLGSRVVFEAKPRVVAFAPPALPTPPPPEPSLSDRPGQLRGDDLPSKSYWTRACCSRMTKLRYRSRRDGRITVGM